MNFIKKKIKNPQFLYKLYSDIENQLINEKKSLEKKINNINQKILSIKREFDNQSHDKSNLILCLGYQNNLDEEIKTYKKDISIIQMQIEKVLIQIKENYLNKVRCKILLKKANTNFNKGTSDQR